MYFNTKKKSGSCSREPKFNCFLITYRSTGTLNSPKFEVHKIEDYHCYDIYWIESNT